MMQSLRHRKQRCMNGRCIIGLQKFDIVTDAMARSSSTSDQMIRIMRANLSASDQAKIALSIAMCEMLFGMAIKPVTHPVLTTRPRLVIKFGMNAAVTAAIPNTLLSNSGRYSPSIVWASAGSPATFETPGVFTSPHRTKEKHNFIRYWKWWNSLFHRLSTPAHSTWR